MSASLGNRLRRLELVRETGEPCPECGFDGDYSKLEATVSVSRLNEGRNPGPDKCSECGRVLVIHVAGLKGGPTK